MQKNLKLISRENAILQHSARLFHEKGYNRTSLRELSKFAGIRSNNIYHYYSSKQEILFRIMQNTIQILISAAKKATISNDPPYKKLRRAIRFHIEFYNRNVCETYVTETEMNNLDPDNQQKINDLKIEYEAIYIDMLRDGVARQEMQIRNIELAVKGLIQMSTGVSNWYHPNGTYSAAEIADKYMDLFYYGLVGKHNRMHRQASPHSSIKPDRANEADS